MRFVIDTNNAIGVAGIMLVAGFAWTIGTWLAGRLLKVLQ